ncbi:hypothetical protein ACVIIW_003902 [Bradyrhizobium sp. USDA 4449]
MNKNSIMQNRRKNKHANDNTPAFTSPDGILVRINRGGNKMQFIRDLCRNEKISHVQFRMLVPLVDMSNEGTHEDSKLWGKAWMNVETLATESGCSERAVQDNMPLLEALGIVKVKRDLTDDGRPKGGRSNFNEYWLPGWNRFGAANENQAEDADDAPLEKKERVRAAPEKGACGSEKGASGSEKGAQRAPDSTHSPHSKTPPKDPPASDERAHQAAGSQAGGEGSMSPEDVRYVEAAEKIWLMFQRAPAKEHDEFVKYFVEDCRAGVITKSEQVRHGLKCYMRDTPPDRHVYPVRFMRERYWQTYRLPPAGGGRHTKRVAI